jgi:hypothetical protein
VKVGDLVKDYALGMNGIVVDGAFIEPAEERGASHDLKWEWLVLYDDGDLMGADSNDLRLLHAKPSSTVV